MGHGWLGEGSVHVMKYVFFYGQAVHSHMRARRPGQGQGQQHATPATATAAAGVCAGARVSVLRVSQRCCVSAVRPLAAMAPT
jgi:hypothetical protein